MSIPKQTTVKCSKCGHDIQATVFESINTDYADDIATQIISGKLFEVKCPHCDFLINLEYDILYNDMKHGAMIWVLHKNLPNYESKVKEIRSAPSLPYKTLRIVEDMNSLKEKVSCLECNRDDRVIEFCKAFAMGYLLNEEPDFDFDKAFYTCNDGRERIYLFDNNGDFRSCQFSEAVENTYKNMSDLYFQSPYSSRFDDNYPIVDSAWAEEIMIAILEPETERIDAKTGGNVSKVETNEDKMSPLCPICNHTLPEDSEFCQYCGNKLDVAITREVEIKNIANTSYTNPNFIPKNTNPKISLLFNGKKKTFKTIFMFSFCFLLALILLFVGFCGYNYSCFTKALNNQEFINAERYLKNMPFGEDVLAEHIDYLNAGILMEEGEYLEAYRALKKIKEYSVPVTVMDDLKSTLYSAGKTAYKNEDFATARLCFAEIPDYKRSSDYILLIECAGSTFDSWSTIHTRYPDLLKLINEKFDNANKILVRNDKFLERFLLGRWENGKKSDQYYFKLYEKDISTYSEYNLPNKNTKGYYTISDGIYQIEKKDSSVVKCFRFSIIDEDTISVYCYKNGKSYKLYRQ